MFILLLFLWIVFNGRFTLEILLFGIVISAAVCLFVDRFTEYSIKKELKLIPVIPSIIMYFLVLIKEILVANLTVIRYVFKGQKSVKPVMVTFSCNLETGFGRTLLANSITLTPGTITVSMRENEFVVHCLDESLAKGISQSTFVKRIAKMEERIKCV